MDIFCANCDESIENWPKMKPCEFCGRAICRECQGMSACQECYKNGCNDCLEQCPICLEMFCKGCIRDHINNEYGLDEKIEEFKKEINESNLSSNTKELIISKFEERWLIEK